MKNECIANALKSLKNFTKEELQNYTKAILERSKEFKDLSNSQALDKAVKEVNEEQLKSLYEDRTIAAKRVEKFEKNRKVMIDKSADARSFLISRGEVLGESVSGAAKAEHEQLIKRTFGQLSHEETEYLSSGKNNEDICDAYDGKPSKNPISQKIAKVIKDYITYRNAQLVLSGAMKLEEINGDRSFRAIHDASKIMTASKSLAKLSADKSKYSEVGHLDAWKNYILPKINMKKTFQFTKAMDKDGNINMEEVHKIMNNIYNNITTGRSIIFTRSRVANDLDAIKNKSRMFFHWNDIRSQYDYNKVFGKGSLVDMLMGDMQATSKKVGAAQILGDDPFAMMNELKGVQQDINGKSNFWWENTDLIFKETLGIDKGSVNPSLSNMTANLRTLTSMARLPLVTLNSLSDIAQVASFGQRIGLGYFNSYTNALSHVFNLFPDAERTHIASLFKVAVDSHLGHMGRWSEANNASDFLNRISSRFFKANLLEAFDKGNKISMMTMMSKALFHASDKSLSEMNPMLQKWTRKFLNDDEWELLRKANKKQLFTTDNVDALTPEQLKSHFEKTGKSLPLSEIQGDLFRKVHSMFMVSSENAVLSPGEFERAMLLRGSTSGSILGEAMRMVTQFKMYGFSYIDKILIQGLKDADTKSQKLLFAASIMAGTLPLSVMSMYLGDMAAGRETKDWDNMNTPEKIKRSINLVQPSLALYSGTLDARNQNGSLVINTLFGSPQTNFIGHTISAPLALLTGNPERAMKEAGKAAQYMLPLQPISGIASLVERAMGQPAQVMPH